MWIHKNVVEACQRFQGLDSSLQLVGGSYEHVFSYTRNEKTYILKLYPIAAKDPRSIETELKWMRFLHKNQINVPLPVRSRNQSYIEKIACLPFPFCAVSYQQVKGTTLNPNHYTTEQDRYFLEFGNLMGKIHHLSKEFTQKNAKKPLYLDEWDEGEIYHHDFSFVGKSQMKQWEHYQEELNQLSHEDHTYGLILNDLHIDKCILTPNGQLAICDFTKIKKHWFAYDIAIAFQHLHSQLAVTDNDSFTHSLLAFVQGYRREHDLAPEVYEQIEFFMRYRKLFTQISEMIRIHKQAT